MNIKPDNKYITVAQKYTEALLQNAKNQNQVNEVFDDLKTVLTTILNSQDLKDFLEAPLVSVKDKQDVLTQIFQNNISEYVFNLLFLLVERNRFNVFQTIFVCYEKQVDAINNILRATVKTVIELDDDIKGRLSQKLNEKFQKNVLIDYQIDSSLIAGLVVQIDDKVIDASLATKFEKMKKQLV